jgi:hypothetical protein
VAIFRTRQPTLYEVELEHQDGGVEESEETIMKAKSLTAAGLLCGPPMRETQRFLVELMAEEQDDG